MLRLNNSPSIKSFYDTLYFSLLLVYGQFNSIYDNIYYDFNARIDTMSMLRVWPKWVCRVVIYYY